LPFPNIGAITFASNYNKVQKGELKRDVDKKNAYEPHTKTEEEKG